MFCVCCRPARSGFFSEAIPQQASDLDAAMARRSAYQRRKSFSNAPVTHHEPTEFIVRNARVLTMDPHIGDISDGDIHVRDGLIVNLGQRLKSSCLHEIDGRETIALPGFVATHRHLLTEALAHDSTPIDVSDAEATDIYCVLRLAMLDALSAGTTSLHHCGHDLDPVFAEIAIMAQLDVGLHGRFSYPVKLDAPDATLPEAAAELAKRWCSAPNDALLDFGLACDPDDASTLGELAPWPITSEHRPIASNDLAGRTRNAARALGLDAHVGSLSPGKQADLILISADASLTPQQALRLAGEFGPDAVRLVSINGCLRKRNGVLTEPNEGLIRREGQEALMRLRSAMMAQDDLVPTGVLLQ